MVQDLIEALGASKTEYEGRGLDFEGDLVKLYSELGKTMSEKYEETDFGPIAVSDQIGLRYGGSNFQVAGCRSRVAGHCFTNTESILNIHKS